MNLKKSFNVILLIFCMTFLFMVSVNAASFGNITGGKTNGKSFKVPIKDAKGFVFTYDKDIISCGGNNTSANNNPYGRLINSDNVEISCSINSSDNKTLTLSLVDLDQNNETISVSYEINPSNTTTTNTQTTSSSTTKKDDVTTTTAAKSKNANLKQLSIKDNEGGIVNLSPSFSSNVYKYEASVNGVIKTVNIEAIAEDSKANIVISKNAQEELKQGENNEIIITVTAEDNDTKKQYVLNIKREVLVSDATLSSLLIEEVPDFEFDSNTFKYNINIDEDISSLTLNYETNDENTTVSISGNEALENGSKIKILVTAEDGTKKEYILNIIKEKITTKKNTTNNNKNDISDKNPLVIMILSLIGFGLIGSIVYVAKK